MTMNADDIIPIEMDYPTPSQERPEVEADAIELDMTEVGQTKCVDCGATGPVDDNGRCRGCFTDRQTAGAPVAELVRELRAIGDQGTTNAAVQGIGSMRGGELRGVGFSSKEGYIQAIRNGVKADTHSAYITTLRTQYGMTSRDIAELNLPGPMAETVLPNGPGIVHTPTPGSVPLFDRPRGERAFVVGPKQETEVTDTKLKAGDLVAGAVAQGGGVLVGWRGLGQLTRGQLAEALEKIGRTDLLPAPMSAHRHAGHVISEYNSRGMVVRAARKLKGAAYKARWSITVPSHSGVAGSSFGDITLSIDLTHEGTLTFDGDEAMAKAISEEFEKRVSGEILEAGDVTGWLNDRLYREFKAVSFGIGFFVAQKHAAGAEALCKAVSETGWGYGWVVPALPIADCDQLRDGIVRGLSEEVTDLMARLASERQTAKDSSASGGGDIGPKRAGTYLKELRAIGQRIVGYSAMLGGERVAQCQEKVRAAIVSLEVLLGDDYSGIGKRFSLIWEEIEMDQRRDEK